MQMENTIGGNMILKLLCTIAFTAPDGYLTLGHEFDADKYEISYGLGDIGVTIEGYNYKLEVSKMFCTLSHLKKGK